MTVALILALLQVNPAGEWRTLHTEHFRVHFRPAHRAVALDAAAEAERAYALLARELHPPRGIIDLTLSDDVDAPNGYANTFPSNRVTVVLVPPVGDPALRSYDGWRRLVIVHELTHVFHLDRSRRLWRFLQAIFGRAPGLFPNQLQPSWVAEGIATYYESRFTGAGRIPGSFHRQVLAADIADGDPRSPWDALLFSRWPAGLTPYAYGGRFWDHVPDSVVPRFVEAAAGQLIPFRVGRPLRHAGLSPSRSLAAVWPLAVAAAAPPPVPVASALVIGGLRAQPVPRVSPDGRRVAYVHADGRGAPRLRIVDWQGGWRTLRSHRVNGQVSYGWQGDTLVVAQLEYAGRWTIRSDLWHWLPDGAWRRITRRARLLEPRGPTMLRLAPGDNALAGSIPLPPDEPATTWGGAVVSPDGRAIAAARHRDGQWALVQWPTGAPDSVRTLVAGGDVADPAWRGDTLLYVADVGGLPQVHAWIAAEDRPVVITAEPLGARAPAALPDGRLLFATLGADGWELRVVAPRRVDGVATTPAGASRVSFDSAPAVATRETGYAALPSLRPHFWIPAGVDVGPAGTFFGALTAGVDAVGRDAYVLAAMVSDSRRFQGSVGIVTHRLGNPTLDVFAANDWSHIGASSTGHEVLANEIEAGLGAALLTQRWRTALRLRLGIDYEGERFATSPDTMPTDVCTGCVQSDRIGGSVSLSLGHVTGGPLTVSAQDGAGVSVLYRRMEEQGTARWSAETRGRLTLYARAGPRVGFAYPVLAARIAAGMLAGPFPEQFSVGGLSSGALPVALGQSLGGGTRAFPVRGYDGGVLRGRRAATVTVEYRVPLALVGRSIGHLPLGVDKLSMALFADVGDAWDPGARPRLHRARALGVELVGDLTVSYDLPLRARAGVAVPSTGAEAGRARLYGGFASDF